MGGGRAHCEGRPSDCLREDMTMSAAVYIDHDDGQYDDLDGQDHDDEHRKMIIVEVNMIVAFLDCSKN